MTLGIFLLVLIMCDDIRIGRIDTESNMCDVIVEISQHNKELEKRRK